MSSLFTAERPHLVVLGLMGVGKSTTAQAIADAQQRPAYDSDRDIETLFDMSGGRLADEHGIDELHRIESAVLLGRLAGESPSVISAAAWVVEDARCREAMANRATVVVLHVSVDENMRRIASGAHRRTMDRDEFVELAERRAPLFAAVADLELDAMRTPHELVEAALSTLG